jgi:hypothetical protein
VLASAQACQVGIRLLLCHLSGADCAFQQGPGVTGAYRPHRRIKLRRARSRPEVSRLRFGDSPSGNHVFQLAEDAI